MMEWTGQSEHRVVVTAPTKSGLIDDLRVQMRERQGFTVATLNLDHAVKMRRHQQFRSDYSAHSHVTADGNPVVWLSRLSGHKGVELIAGSDISGPVIEVAAQEGIPVAFFGSSDGVLSKASDNLMAAYPKLKIVARISPPLGFDPDGPDGDRALAQLAASGARLVMLALGAPKQERFAIRASQHMPEAGFLSVGASLDFFAGHQRRAPRWMRRIAMEWAWRLAREPRRLMGRYAACFAILPRLTLRALWIRLFKNDGGNPSRGREHA